MEGNRERRSGGFGRNNDSEKSFGNRSGSGRSFGNRGSFNRNNSSFKREMHKAVCDECKKECEVPFKPTEGKPVYCRDCFNKRQ